MASIPSLSTIGVALIAVTLLGLLCYRACLPKPIPGIPYKKGSERRILGDAPDILAYKGEHGDFFAYIAELVVKMNEPVIQMFVQPLGRPWVIVNDPRENYDILTRRTKDFDHSNFFGQIFTSMIPKHHVHMPTGDEWHAHRRLVSETMSPAFLNGVAGPQMWFTMRSMIDLWQEKARLAEGRPFDAESDIHNTTLDIIWAATFGGEIGPNMTRAKRLAAMQKMDLAVDKNSVVEFPETEDPAAFKSITALAASMEIPLNSIIPTWEHWFALTTRKDLRTARKHKDELIITKLREAQKQFSQKSKSDLEATAGLKSALDLLVAREMKMAEKEGRPTDLESQAIQDELFGLLIAGQDTTSTTVCWGLKFLTQHQEAQTKLRHSLRSSFKRAAESKETPTVEEITSTQVDYLDAVVEEIPRVGIPALATVRKALRDTDVLGYRIPKGTDVFFMNNGPGFIRRSLGVDESKRSKSSQDNKDKIPAWDDGDITEFKPERWLDKDGRFVSHAGPAMAFGAGPRGCFGRKWANLELRIILIFIIWNFELLPTPPALSTFKAIDALTHRPKQCYVKLRALT